MSYLEQLGSRIGRTAAPGGECKAGHKPVGESKVRQLDVAFSVQQQVLCFEVSEEDNRVADTYRYSIKAGRE